MTTRSSRAVLTWVAGPLLICGTVLLVLHGYAFQGLISIRQPDVLPFWFPTWCYLGKSLAAGHIPAWNPHVMGGIRFAADPQSGWGFVPAMALFSALQCGLAIRWFIVLQPILAGLGLFAFLRSEGLSRAGATVGGLALALGLAGSGFVTPPFAGVFAWTALLLAASSRLFRATTWPSRLLWLMATALAWGQLVAAHPTQGLFVGSAALFFYVVVRIVGNVRTRANSLVGSLGLASFMIAMLPLVNMAVLLPRLSYLPETSLGQGYRKLQILNAGLTGRAIRPPAIGGYELSFPLRFSVPGGVYLGVAALALVFAGWRARRLRLLWLSFALYGLVSYVLGLHVVVEALFPAFGHGAMQSLYSHAQNRLGWGLVVALPVLAAVGVDAWRERAGPATRMTMVGPAVLVWLLLPLALGLHRQELPLPAVGSLVVVVVLGLVALRPSAVVLIPVVLAAELSVNGLMMGTASCCDGGGSPLPSTLEAFQPSASPQTAAASYERPGPIVRAIRSGRGGRYLSIGFSLWTSGEPRWSPRNWPFMGTQRSMLFGIEEAQGYNPAQLMRYWTFMRAVQREPISYNQAFFERAEPLAMDLLQVAYVIQPSAANRAVPGSTPAAVEGAFTLYRLADPAPRASVVTTWTVVASPDEARRRVVLSGFDPNTSVVLEKDPGLARGGGGTGSATYIAQGDQAARVSVQTTAPGLVLVRNAYDPNWHATVDGHRAHLLAADSLIQAVPVGAGRHVVRLTYDDPAIGWGLFGSALSLLSLVVAAGLLLLRDRRRSRIS